MKLHYYAGTDSLYIELKSSPGTETREVASGLNVDSMPTEMSWDSTSTMRPSASNFRRWRLEHCPSRCTGPVDSVLQRVDQVLLCQGGATRTSERRQKTMAMPNYQPIMPHCSNWLRTTRVIKSVMQ